ncbi:ATP-binding protein [Pseudoalteromonas sp. SSDWG2]|uniref:ATP-binding protein n=1 Tax=Pseudoalteromonas sp. SSDWG2 TaxID=3139391 RepID=UPI003BAC7559
MTRDSEATDLVQQVTYFIKQQQLSDIQCCEVATICSELIYNMIKYAQSGELRLNFTQDTVIILSQDQSSGFAMPLLEAFAEGASTGGSLGLGLPSVLRMSDDFSLATSNSGTTITCSKVL